MFLAILCEHADVITIVILVLFHLFGIIFFSDRESQPERERMRPMLLPCESLIG